MTMMNFFFYIIIHYGSVGFLQRLSKYVRIDTHFRLVNIRLRRVESVGGLGSSLSS